MKVRLYARTEVVRLLRIDRRLLDRLEEEEIVRSRRGRFSARDVERVRIAAELLNLDVNPEGLEIILRMRERWLAERRELHAAIEALRAKLLER
ncbi:MAG: MerR family transcriptional regulator [Myxococcales bacterium]